MDDVQLTYWIADPPEATDTPPLLIDGDGQCGSWASLFRDVILAQGIGGAVKQRVEHKDAPGVIGFLIKPWTFDPGFGTLDLSEYSFPVDALGNQAVRAKQGLLPLLPDKEIPVADLASSTYRESEAKAGKPKAQGNDSSSPTSFYNHFIVRYAGKIYDPSYGGGTYLPELQWEASSLSGFGVRIRDPGTGAYLFAWSMNWPGSQVVFSDASN